MTALAEHLDHVLILRWIWNPGGGREPAPTACKRMWTTF